MKGKTTFTVTPLGAAIVEAMPDKKAQRAIQRNFRKQSECPTSRLYPTVGDVASFYRQRGEQIRGVQL